MPDAARRERYYMNSSKLVQGFGSLAEFVGAFGGVYEHSPWVAERAWPAVRPESSVDSIVAAMRQAVEDAGYQAQLTLLQAHPDLGQRLGVRDELTSESQSEQTDAGLDACSPEEYEEFQRLNLQYRETFGFPFILAVRGFDRAGILEQFRLRIENSRPAEFRTALEQVHRIACLRIEDIVAGDG